MMKLCYYLLLLLVGVASIQCNKTTDDPNDLPPETQTGAGTFACKINGAVWKYKYHDYEFLSSRPVTHWSFSPNESMGVLRISGQRYTNDNSVADDVVALGADSLTLLKERITIGDPAAFGLDYNNYNGSSSCQYFASQQVYDRSKNFYRDGKLTLTYLDLKARIISGTFYCTIYQTGCDTLKITDGRFDLKY